MATQNRDKTDNTAPLKSNAVEYQSSNYGWEIVHQLRELIKAEQLENNQTRPTPTLSARINVLLKSYPNTRE